MEPVIGVVVALPSEFRSLAGSRRPEREDHRRLLRSHLPDGIEIVFVQSGVGMEGARSAANWLARSGAAAIASIGLSGGLSPNLSSGDLIVSDSVLQEGPTGMETVWSSNPTVTDGFRRALARDGFSVFAGPVVTSENPVLDARGKQSLYQRSGALAVDMETAGVARVAAETNRPFLCVRAVCDPADHSVPPELFSLMDASGRIRITAVLTRVIGRPSLIVEMLRTGREFRTALNALHRAWAVSLRTGLPGLFARGDGVD